MRIQYGLTALMLLTGVGCTGMNNTQQGAVTGGVLGGLVGLAVGGRHPAAAAAIGAGGGALLGGAVGAGEDRRDERRTATAIAVANERARNQMSLTDVIQLSQRGTSDDVIIRQMDATGSVFNLTTNDIIDLQNQSVSSRLISAMQARRYARMVVVPQREVIYVAPPPPIYVEPGVSVGIRGRW